MISLVISPQKTMTSIIILLLALPVVLLLLQRGRKTKGASILLPPGPKGLPLIGNLHQLDVSKPYYSLWKLSNQYGPLMSLRLGRIPTLVVSSAKMAKEIFKTHDLKFSSRTSSLGRQMLSYNFLDLAFTPYDDYWREMRKMCGVHLFNSNKVQCSRPIREDEVSRMIEKISKLSVASKPVNLSELTMSATTTIICRVAFGKRYEDEGIERNRFQDLLHETEAMFISFFFSDYIPFLGWLDKITGLSRRLEKNFKECDRFYQELIDDHLDPQRPKKEQDEEDVIDVLLRIQKNGGCKIDLTLNHVKALLMNVFIGGTDTSAVTVVWAMNYLMMNPRVMKKAHEEIRSSVGNKGFVDEDDLQRLPYLKAIVKETMRLQPAGPLLIPRETIENCIVDGYEIPAKTAVYVNAWAIGRDPEVWKNPEEFDPDRFIGSCIDLKGQHYELMPFGTGRRICPGIVMGLAMVELLIANLLYKFNWEMPVGMKKEDLDCEPLPGLAVHKKHALCLMATNYI